MKGAYLHPKIGSSLLKLQQDFMTGLPTVQSLAPGRNITVDSQNRVTVYIYLENGLTVDDISFQGFDVQIVKSSGNVIKANVPLSMLDSIADSVSGITFIKVPDMAHSANIIGEGISLTGASAYHSDGITGSGVKIAIIDGGFMSLSAAISNGEIPASATLVDCTGSGCVPMTSYGTTQHGTAVTEIAYDMAPGAQFYLIKIADSLDLIDAKNYCVSNGIDIVNHSVQYWNTNFYDGSCWYNNPVCTVEDAFANNILWVNAAGNQAQHHYEDTFTDGDSDGFHDVRVTFNVTAGENIEAFLTWDGWPTTSQDYDLYLFDPSGIQVAQSENTQSGTQPPIEHFLYNAPSSGTYSIGISRFSGTQNNKLELYEPYQVLDQAVPSSSLVNPADAVNVMAVGAMNWSDWTTGPQETFSSQGPTNDGRIKPDIVGPDGVSGFTYSINSGTSMSTPHVAGAAALILSRNPGYSPSDLGSILTNSAIDMGDPGVDNIYGNGRLNLLTPDKIGLFRPTIKFWLLDINGNGIWDAGPGADKAIQFGILNGDLPIPGDWNGDGKTEVGIYRPSKNLFLRDVNGNGIWDPGPGSDKELQFGIFLTDIPIVGDWNGDGKTEIGLYRSSVGAFLLDVNGNGFWDPVVADKYYVFDTFIAGDVPIAGDWNGDGTTEIGLFRASTKSFLLDMNGNGIWDPGPGPSADKSIVFSLYVTGDSPITGDWNGDGTTNIGLYRPSINSFLLDKNGNGIWDPGPAGDIQIVFGVLSTDLPVIGKW